MQIQIGKEYSILRYADEILQLFQDITFMMYVCCSIKLYGNLNNISIKINQENLIHELSIEVLSDSKTTWGSKMRNPDGLFSQMQQQIQVEVIKWQERKELVFVGYFLLKIFLIGIVNMNFLCFIINQLDYNIAEKQQFYFIFDLSIIIQIIRYSVTMIKLVVCLLLSLLICQSQIIQLTSSNIEDFLAQNKQVFLYFYSNTCKQCFGVINQFGKLEKEVQNLNLKLARINGTAEIELVKLNKIKKYPTVMLADNEQIVQYKGSPNSASSMKNWLTDYYSNRVVTIAQEQLGKRMKPYLLIKGESENQRKIINKAFYGIVGADCYRVDSDQKDLSIQLHLNNETVKFSQSLQKSRLKKWIEQNLKTIVQSLKSNQENDKVFFNQKLPALVIVFAQNDRKFYDKFKLFVQVCQQNKQKVICGQVIPQYESFDGAHGFFKIKDTNKSFMAVVKQSMKIAYRQQITVKTITKQQIQKFLNDALDDKIQRIVDNTPPETTKFNHVRVLTPQNIQSTVDQNKYVFLNYYLSDEQVSLIFSRPYQSLAETVKNQQDIKNVVIAALDCKKYHQFCQKQGFKHYPFLRLFINGVKIDFQKTKKLPQIPDLTRFIYSKKQKKIKPIQSKEDITKLQKPLVVVECQKISPQIQALPALCDCNLYHLKVDKHQETILLHHSQQVVKYEGKIQVQQINNWIQQQTEFLLLDIMKQNPHPRVLEATKSKKPILLLLSTENDKDKKLKTKVGLITKKLKICGTFTQESHQQFPQVLKWIGLRGAQSSKLVYIDLKLDRKYAYKGDLNQATFQDIQSFVIDVQQGKLKPQSLQDQDQVEEKPIVEQL